MIRRGFENKGWSLFGDDVYERGWWSGLGGIEVENLFLGLFSIGFRGEVFVGRLFCLMV